MSSDSDQLKILFFSSLQAVVGETEILMDQPESLTISELLGQLYQRYPELEQWDSQIGIAVNLTYCRRNTEVRNGDEVAIMPPVQGG